MTRFAGQALLLLAALMAVFLGTACSVVPYRYAPLEDEGITSRAESQERGGYRVLAAVPGAEETRRLFGVSLYDAGIQPVWLQVSNPLERRARVVLSSIDPKYYPPHEVAYMYRKRFSRQGWQDMEAHLYRTALPRQIAPQQTVSGFVFTNLDNGTKAFNVDVFDTGGTDRYEQFTFFLDVPGFVPDHANVDFAQIYSPDEVSELDAEGLRALLHSVPCCTRNRADDAQGRPVNLFFVADGADLLRALLRAGWSETSYTRDEAYRDKADYFFGRVPDAIFRKGRDRGTERVELSLWLAPVRVDGKPLWAGQVRHAIGRRFEIGEFFLGVNLDPDTCDGRDYLLQDLWYAQSLLAWAWSDSGIDTPADAPERDFNGNPWFTRDPFRSVIWISGVPVALSEARDFNWAIPIEYLEETR